MFVFLMLAMCMCFGGFDGVQRVGDFGEFLYFKDSSGVFHVVQCVL